MDSPRGRIQLMEAKLDGTLPLSPTMVTHFDRCLGCLACVSSCPSGVQYDRLIEETRHVVEQEHRRPRGERLQRRVLFATLPYPRRMRWALRLAPIGRRLPAPGWARPLLDVAPPWRSRSQAVAAAPPDGAAAIGRVGLLAGCVQRAMFGDVNAATARALVAAGYEVVVPRQGCCGALSAHAGRKREAERFTSALREAFEGVDTIVVNASGCGSHLKDHGALAIDLSEALRAGRLPDAPPARADRRLPGLMPPPPRPAPPGRVEPRSLQAIPGLRLVETAEQDLCCGSAGIYNVTQPEAARAARRPQGGPRPCDGARRVHERQPRLPRADRAGARPRRLTSACAAPGRAPRCVDPRRRRGASCSAELADEPSPRRGRARLRSRSRRTQDATSSLMLADLASWVNTDSPGGDVSAVDRMAAIIAHRLEEFGLHPELVPAVTTRSLSSMRRSRGRGRRGSR